VRSGASQVGPCTFDDVTALVEDGPGRFHAHVDPGWTIGGKPNGGYLLATLARAAGSITTQPHAIAASAHYLHAPQPGPVAIETELLRAGRSASQVRARMSQNGEPCVEALLTTAWLDPTAAPYWQAGLPPAGDTSYDESIPLAPQGADGDTVAIMEQIDVRIDPASSAFLTGKPSGCGELRGWLGLKGCERFDPASLIFAVDAFPPATFDIEFAGWVPTLELTAYIRALPAPGPVRVLQRAELIDAQRVNEACYVWDRTGRLVAQGTQLAGIRLG
jgi:Thioesterase-like superfamily